MKAIKVTALILILWVVWCVFWWMVASYTIWEITYPWDWSPEGRVGSVIISLGGLVIAGGLSIGIFFGD